MSIAETMDANEREVEVKRKRLEEILEEHGIKISIGSCGCCDSPWVKVEHNGVEILDESNFYFSNFDA